MNFIKKYYLNKGLRKFVQQKKDKKIIIQTINDANSVCFFVSGSDANKVNDLLKSIAIYNEKKITIICYLPHREKLNIENSPPFLHFVSPKDISITGQIKKHVPDIFSQNYDIFIDLDTNTDLMSLYLKTLLNADFRIGGNREFYNYFDFTLCANEQYTMNDYLSNLEVYTLKLNATCETN